MKRILFYSFLIALCSVAFVSCDSKEDDPVEEQFKSTVLVGMTITSQYLGGDLGTYNIYLPTDWETTDKKYPVLYLFHGMYGDNTDWTNNNMKQMSDIAIKSNKTCPFIVVMPNAWNSFYVDGLAIDKKIHNYESFFWKELKPYIESHYPVLTGKENTAISGLSMGGFGSTYYAFTRPECFCFCYSMSGAVEGFGTDQIPSLKRIFSMKGYTEADYDRLPRYVMDCGTEDTSCHSANENTHAFLESVAFPHEYIAMTGIHDWVYWKACYQRLLDRLGKYFKPE